MYDIPAELIAKYAVIGPRYTSYPTAPSWRTLDSSEQSAWIDDEKDSLRPLALYFHIPFCRERCFYCGCNVHVTRRQSRSAVYVDHLLKEMESLRDRFPEKRRIRQLHFGGGTPNFLLDVEFEAIWKAITENFTFEPEAEAAIEIDPVSTRPNQLAFLRELGFNRLSLGVQDFDERVQQAINRLQSRELTRSQLEQARSLGFQGINFDLIYGLPYQTVESFSQTLETVITMRPDRLAVYNFGYLPERMPHQRKIKPETLPDTATKLALLQLSIQRLTEAGYRYIGMDHFALPNDELAIALDQKRLYRNFMGYTPKSGVDLYGIGMTAISEFGPYFVQNAKTLDDYQRQVAKNGLAGCRGMRLSRDDLMRKWTIIRLICHFQLSFSDFQRQFRTDFQTYFDKELQDLRSLEIDGLLEIHPNRLAVVGHGQILVRNICMVFDAYLNRAGVPPVRYSKTI
jgi:oxygen-independent coproporphyrinogen III oxidase